MKHTLNFIAEDANMHFGALVKPVGCFVGFHVFYRTTDLRKHHYRGSFMLATMFTPYAHNCLAGLQKVGK